MLFGLHGVPAIFQRLMNKVLAGMEKFAAAYLDDIFIHSSSWEEHLTHLEAVFGRIKEAGMTVHPKKYTLAKQELEYLGYNIGNGEIKPVKDKVKAIRMREMVSTERAAPLSDLTSTVKSKLVRGEEQEKAFSVL